MAVIFAKQRDAILPGIEPQQDRCAPFTQHARGRFAVRRIFERPRHDARAIEVGVMLSGEHVATLRIDEQVLELRVVIGTSVVEAGRLRSQIAIARFPGVEQIR